MPVLPEVTRDYNVGVGRLADTSSDQGDAALYGAISQLSEGVGKFAAQVAGDLNRAEAKLKATENVSKYQAAYEQKKNEIQNNPNITMYKQAQQVQDEWVQQQKNIKQSMLDNSSSYLEQEYTRDALAGSEGKEAVDFLAFKEKRIKEEVDQVQKQSLADLSLSLSDLDTTYDKGNKIYKETSSSHAKNMSGLLPREQFAEFNTQAANIAAVRSTETALRNKRDLEALTMIVGPDAANKIMGKAQKNYIDGLDSSTDPEIQKLVKFKSNLEMLQNVDAPTQEHLIKMVLGSVFNKHKEDDSVHKKNVKNATEESFEGKNIDENKIKDYKMLAQATPATATDIETMDANDPLVFALVARNVRNARKYPLATQEKTNQFIVDNMPLIVKEIVEMPELQENLKRLGKGDIEKGKAVYSNRLSQYDKTRRISDFLKSRFEADKKAFKEDPIAHSQEVFKLSPIEEDTIGSFINRQQFLFSRNPKEWKLFSDALKVRQDNAKGVIGGFNPTNEILTKEETRSMSDLFDKGLNDQGLLTNFLIGLNSLPPDQKIQVLEQIKRPELIVASNNPEVLQQLGEAVKNYTINKQRSGIVDPEGMKTFKQEVLQYDINNNFSAALIRGNTSNATAIRNGYNEAVEKLALGYMANGVDKDKAIAQASKDLIADQVKVLEVTGNFSNANKVHVIFPKNFKYEEEQVQDHLIKPLKTDAALDGLNLVMPEMVKEHYRNAGPKGKEMWYADIKETLQPALSADGKSFDLGYVNKRGNDRGTFVKLFSQNEGRISEVRFGIGKVEEIVSKGIEFESKKVGFWDNLVETVSSPFKTTEKEVHALNNIQSISKQMSYRDYTENVSDAHLEQTLELEGYNPKTFNVISNSGTGDRVGGIMFKAAFDDVYTSMGKKPLKDLKEYATALKSPSDFKEHVRKYKQILRVQANKRISDYESFPEPAKKIVEDAMFTTGAAGFMETGIDKLLKAKRYEAVETAFKGNPRMVSGGNYKDNRLKRIHLWINQLRQMDNQPVTVYQPLKKKKPSA
jgi:hypothetical protein